MAIASGAQAQQAAVPEGCAAVMTVQTRGCTVQHRLICEDLAPGDFRLALYGPGGPFLIGHYNRHYQTLASVIVPTQKITRSLDAGPDPLNMDELLDDGLDTYDFTEVEERPGSGPVEVRMMGFDRLTGDTIEIDGRSLLVTEFEYRRIGPDGEVMEHFAGQQFVDPDFLTIYAGTFIDKTGGSEPNDLSPVKFYGPDDPGFLSAVPRHDCPATDASFSLPSEQDQ
ncbi:MAG: hypothetical protein AAGF71_01165 [Pseudomonadota bacterium]